jgi:hypothetical protein
MIRPGFSGGGRWSDDCGAVVGIVGQAHAKGKTALEVAEEIARAGLTAEEKQSRHSQA